MHPLPPPSRCLLACPPTPHCNTQVDEQFRVLWADHGDEVSRQYAGTGAMKSAFTRTGKRDIWGLLDDGAKSLTRCVAAWRADAAVPATLRAVRARPPPCPPPACLHAQPHHPAWRSYYLNNFEDGHKQDALDLVAGAYTVVPGG